MNNCFKCIHYDVCIKWRKPALYGIAPSLGCTNSFKSKTDFIKIKHATWQYKPYNGDNDLWLYHCSACGTPNAQKRKYCNECGAAMDCVIAPYAKVGVNKKERTINKNNPKNIYCDHCEHYNKVAGLYREYVCSCEQSKHYLNHREYYHRCKHFEWKWDANYA